MADNDTAPLSDEERAELEALRAEKAAREQAERARRERAELEALRAERAASEEGAAEPAPASAAEPSRAAAERPVVDPDNPTFGQRMVMTPEGADEDGIPGMPPAQKLVIGLCLLLAVGGGIWVVLSNAGVV